MNRSIGLSCVCVHNRYVCVCVCVCVRVCVCVCVYVEAAWCSGCVLCSQPKSREFESPPGPYCCDLEQVTLFPLFQCTDLAHGKIGTWLLLVWQKG